MPIEKKVEEVKVTKPVRARNKKGQLIGDDPNTPENEAWVGGVAPKRKTRKTRTRKTKEVSKYDDETRCNWCRKTRHLLCSSV